MPGGIRIVVLMLLALVCARANGLAQTTQFSDPRFISEGKPVIRKFLDSVERVYSLGSHSYSLSYSNDDSSFFSHEPITITGASLSVRFDRIERRLDQSYAPDGRTFLCGSITLKGTMVASDMEIHFSSNHPLFCDTIISSGRTITGPKGKEEGFWESTAQPVLVSVGAVVIVALFFMIRS